MEGFGTQPGVGDISMEKSGTGREEARSVGTGKALEGRAGPAWARSGAARGQAVGQQGAMELQSGGLPEK
jgi:hypothetical protein